MVSANFTFAINEVKAVLKLEKSNEWAISTLIKIYREQLEMAKSISMPAVVHCRESDDDVLKGIQESCHGMGVIHCFASDLEFANSILKTGFCISFTGMITFVQELEKVVVEIPLDKIISALI